MYTKLKSKVLHGPVSQLSLSLHDYSVKLDSTLLKSGGGFLPRQRFDKHQMAFLIIDILPDFCNSLQQAQQTTSM